MSYRNGREAKQGDVVLHTPSRTVGVLIDAVIDHKVPPTKPDGTPTDKDSPAEPVYRTEIHYVIAGHLAETNDEVVAAVVSKLEVKEEDCLHLDDVLKCASLG